MSDALEQSGTAAFPEIPDAELIGYVDELLPSERAAAIESLMRTSAGLRQRISGLIRRRDQGGHTIGEIWRRRQISCPSRSDLGAYVLGVLEPGHADYVRFHINVIGCRLCEANLSDLEQASKKADQQTATRRQRFFESSAGGLSKPAP
jgi:hypothetical protein